jgi:hypothetical protein
MIKSPCKSCENLFMSKDVCSTNCEKIKNLQMFQISVADVAYMAVDSSDSGRYRLRLPGPAASDM